MKIVGVIPARYASTRFPGKPLALLQGRPMIQWTIEGAKKSRLCSEVIVATDNEEIAKAAKTVGAKVVMTDSDLPTGTDRIYAAVRDLDCDLIVNIQGDEPTVTGELVDQLAQVFIDEPHLDMATLAHPISEEDIPSLNAVKVIVNRNDEALYFSRYPIPYSRLEFSNKPGICLRHIGMYAYTKKFLKLFCESQPADIELAESLEQLRALYLGASIKVVRVQQPSIGVDTPEDLAKLEKILSQGI